jgi:hypothetical protein
VIWGYKHNRLYSHALVIEHESTLIWSEDKLGKLYDMYNRHHDIRFIFDVNDWLLDDNTGLTTKCEIIHKGFELNIIIFEVMYLLRPKKPLRIDSNR